MRHICLFCGMTSLHKEIEARVAKLVGKEEAVLFPTEIYHEPWGNFLSGRDRDLILIDGESHSSMINGCKLSIARKMAFKHNDIADLERKLKKYGHAYETFLSLWNQPIR